MEMRVGGGYSNQNGYETAKTLIQYAVFFCLFWKAYLQDKCTALSSLSTVTDLDKTGFYTVRRQSYVMLCHVRHLTRDWIVKRRANLGPGDRKQLWIREFRELAHSP